MLLPDESALAQELNERYVEERQGIVDTAFAIFDAKGKKYDSQVPFWHRHKDPGAFIHELEKKVGRLAQVHEVDPVQFAATPEQAAYGESALEQLDDIINYACMLYWVLAQGVEQIDTASIAAKSGSAPVGLVRGIMETLVAQEREEVEGDD